MTKEACDTPRDEVMAALERVREYVVHVAWPNLAAQEDALADISLLRTELERRKVPDTDLLAELRKHDARMTPGEWAAPLRWGNHGVTSSHITDSGYTLDEHHRIVRTMYSNDSEGIAALRNALPRIIAALEQAERLRGVEEERDAQQRAANHWFSEANRDHNDLVRVDAALRRAYQATTAVRSDVENPSESGYHLDTDTYRWLCRMTNTLRAIIGGELR